MSFNNQTIDLAIVYIHGEPGENGKIQALLDMKGIPYLNSGPLASSLSFDKWFCNQFLKSFDIPVAKSILLTSTSIISEDLIIQELELPVFVKPADSGSSYGISKVKTKKELKPAIEGAFSEGKTVVIEAFLNGTEVTCGVYRNKEGVVALPLTEIASENEFFDYAAKYEGKSKEVTPAENLTEEIQQEMSRMSKEIFQFLNCRGLSRVDYLLRGDEIFFMEINTIPGLSEASIYPQQLNHYGYSLKEGFGLMIENILKN
jgi:D-alanine-D-alanine ligase